MKSKYLNNQHLLIKIGMELTGFPTLLMSNWRATPLGIFFSAVSTLTGADLTAGGCSLYAVGGLPKGQTSRL